MGKILQSISPTLLVQFKLATKEKEQKRTIKTIKYSVTFIRLTQYLTILVTDNGAKDLIETTASARIIIV